MLDVCIPTVDGRELLLIRHTEPDADVALLLEKLNLSLPPQTSSQDQIPRSQNTDVVPTFLKPWTIDQ